MGQTAHGWSRRLAHHERTTSGVRPCCRPQRGWVRTRSWARSGRGHGRGLPRPRHAPRPRGRDQGPARRAARRTRHRRARFVQEARAASALNHPHIVTIYEIESAEGVDFIVMELVPGKTLDALIPRSGMRLGEALRIAIPLADALAAAHAAGIVHRDLKPANVMVTPEGVVKVLDFGLAKLTQADEGGGEDATTLDAQARLSHPGTVAGTPAYMSPEQASRRRGRRAQRHLLLRGGALRDGDGPAAVRRRLERRDARRSAEGAAASRRASSCPTCRRSWSGSSCTVSARSPAGASSTWWT